MIFVYPWAFLILSAVFAAAVWALFRPGRSVAIVSSLRLWRQATEGVNRASKRSTRRISASWIFLFAGAVLAVLAMAWPVYHSQVRSRRIALELYPSAEIAGKRGMDVLKKTAVQLIDRLDGDDRVWLIRPAAAGGVSKLLTKKRAIAEVNCLFPIPISARKMLLPPRPDESAYVYRIAPADGTNGSAESLEGELITTIEIPTDLPNVAIERIAAEELASGDVQVFVSIVSNEPGGWSGMISLDGLGEGGKWNSLARENLTIPSAGKFARIILSASAAEAIRVSVLHGGKPIASAWLVRESSPVASVAIVGVDDPMLRRFVQVNPSLILVGSMEQADIVIANRSAPPRGKCAIVINPPTLPTGWKMAKSLANIVTGNADIDADDPVMAAVSLKGVSIRKCVTWRRDSEGTSVLKPLASIDGDAILLRNQPEKLASSRSQKILGRVFITFDVNAQNTNLAISPQLIIFLANSVRWLAPELTGKVRYTDTTPLDAGNRNGWTCISPSPSGTNYSESSLTPPGLYKESASKLHAVNLTGLRSAKPQTPPALAVEQVTLPKPEFHGSAIEFWYILLTAAVICWLVGWTIRFRK